MQRKVLLESGKSILRNVTVLDHPLVLARLHLLPDQFQQREDKSGGAQPLRLPWRAGRV
jgi:hypothetical protein